ncbi:hypothetical protein D3C81_1263570 [compost metagenome]
MKLRSTLFLSAMARILASASTSVSDSGSASGAGDLIEPGTMASVIASSESWPTMRSICAISASLGPMWRSTNAEECSSSRSEGMFWGMADVRRRRAGRVSQVSPVAVRVPRARHHSRQAGGLPRAPLSFCLRVWKRRDEDRALRAPSAPE